MRRSAWALAEVPLSDFARNDSFDDASISPDGHYVALTVPVAGGRGVAVLDLKKGKIILKQGVGDGRSAVDYLWASNERLVVSLAEDFGGGEEPIWTGELVAFNADGTNQEYLFGFRGGVASGTAALGSRLGKGRTVNARGLAIRSLPNDPDHILIQARNFGADADDGRTTAYRLSVRDGKIDRGVAAPISGWVRFVADDTGFVRYAVGEDDRSRVRSFARSPEKPEWAELPVPAGTTARAGIPVQGQPAGVPAFRRRRRPRVSGRAASGRRHPQGAGLR